jgi:hypothetical protein
MFRSLKVVNVALLIMVLVGTAACAGEARSPVWSSKEPASRGASGPVGSSAAASATETPAAAGEMLASEDARSAGGAAAEPTTASAAAASELTPSGRSDAAPGAGIVQGTTDDTSLYYGSRPQVTYQSPLTAGQVDDNARFDDYMTYLRGYQGPPARVIPVERRLFVRVVDEAQQPVAGARVQLFDGDRQVFDGRTVSDGRVLFFPQAAQVAQAQQFRAVVSRGQQQVEANLRADLTDQTVPLAVDDNTGPVGLDLVFLLDATGSMGDEIDTIKATVDSIAARIEQLPGSSMPRFGLVAFRDLHDEYVTRSWDFGDVQQFAANLSQVSADGGGDEPESVNAGLHEAIHLPGWADASSGRHLRMIVLVGDAPPHLDYANDYEYPDLLEDAVAAGIKIFPIGASGLDDLGEYVFRQLAQVTQGQFVFLTYANGVSGEPGMATDHHVSDFTVRNLDSLVVGLVASEIANQTGQDAQAAEPAPVAVTQPVPYVAPPVRTASLAGITAAALEPVIQVGLWLWALLLLLLWAWRRRTGDLAAGGDLQSVEFTLPPAPARIGGPDADALLVPDGDLLVPEGLALRAEKRAESLLSAPSHQHTVPLSSLPPGLVPVAVTRNRVRGVKVKV